jgi:hypothetical protein
MAGCLFLEMLELQSSFSLLIVNEGSERGFQHAVEPVGFIDFKFYYSLGAEDFVGLECKRVSGAAKDTRLAEEYVKEGVERYVAAKYCVGHNYGLMLGFVVDGTEVTVRRQVRSALNRRTQQSRMVEKWNRSARFDALWSNGGVSETRHEQEHTNVCIRVLHFFAEFP